MLRSCKYCGKIHDTKYKCPNKPSYFPKQLTKGTEVHRSYRWTKLSADIRTRDAYICRYCLSENRINNVDIEVHHIESIEENFSRAYDATNLISLCRKHHELAEKGVISKATLFELIDNQKEKK